MKSRHREINSGNLQEISRSRKVRRGPRAWRKEKHPLRERTTKERSYLNGGKFLESPKHEDHRQRRAIWKGKKYRGGVNDTLVDVWTTIRKGPPWGGRTVKKGSLRRTDSYIVSMKGGKKGPPNNLLQTAVQGGPGIRPLPKNPPE